MKTTLTTILVGMFFCISHAQIYRQYLPVNAHAQISYITPGSDLEESILFDAQPIARYHFFNNFEENNISVNPNGRAYYVSFRPHLRMYNSQSNPVRTPSYKIALGGQWSKRFGNSKEKAQQLAISFESGHYSNGQPNCFLDEDILDGLDACDDAYNRIANGEDITSEVNRESGNFSTNWTELILQYKWLTAEQEDFMENSSHSVRLGYTLYHDKFLFVGNFGGYSDDDIKLYGQHFFHFRYEYSSFFNMWGKAMNFEVSQTMDWVSNADERVPELRSLTKVVLFPFESDLGVFASFIKGRDDYNIRFVDNVTQFQIGLLWTGKTKISLDLDD